MTESCATAQPQQGFSPRGLGHAVGSAAADARHAELLLARRRPS